MHNIEDIFVQRSNVCLEPTIKNQTQIVNQVRRAIKSITIGNETKGFENERNMPCGKEFSKLKFQHMSSKFQMMTPDTPYYEFLKINLRQGASITTTYRKTTPFWVVIGTIGGVRLFLQLLFSIFGTWFSSKFFKASLADALYVKLKNKDKMYDPTEYEGGMTKPRDRFPSIKDVG